MANKMNYAEQWSDELLQIIDDGAYSSPFLTPAERVKWTGAKTFHFTRMDVSGFKNHSRDGGYNRGSVIEEDKDFTLEHDRDVDFLWTLQTSTRQSRLQIFRTFHAYLHRDILHLKQTPAFLNAYQRQQLPTASMRQ